MKKRLSILICSLSRRKPFLDRIKKILQPQMTDEVEVLVNIDDGEISTGEKRNLLLTAAIGDYIAYIDDDDIISDDYIPLILQALNGDPDVVGMHLLHEEDDILKGLTYHSLKYTDWWHEPNKDTPGLMNYYRNPNHLNPVRRDLALQVQFPHVYMCEDRTYSKNLLPLLKIEVYIEKPIYTYKVRTRKDI